MPAYPVHPQRHPPGLPLLFALGRQVFDQAPGLTGSLNAVLRPYQCSNLPLMDLPNGSIASAVIQMSVPLLLGVVVWPLYQLGRKIYDENTARRAALLWPLIPSIALWATRWDQLFALFTAGAFLSLLYGLSKRRPRGWVLSGLIVACALFFSFGNLVIIALLGLYTVIWWITTTDRPALRWLLLAAGSFVAGVALPWILLWLIFQLDPIATWRTAMGIHLGLDRSYVTWLFFHPYDFFVFLGIPLAVLWLVRTFNAFRDLRQRRQPLDALAITFVVVLVLLIISGTSRGEVARVWAFLLPLPLLIALYRLPERPIVFTSLIGLMALQVFIGNIFLRPVGTGLTDPPAPPPASANSLSGALAEWQAGMILQSAQAPHTASHGGTIEMTATWSTSQQIDRPYTLFVHVLDQQGKLLAQYDGMARDNTWPTTCWQPGRSFDDAYHVALPAETAPGVYHVQLGYYWLPSGERVPVSAPNAGADPSVEVGTIEVK